MVRALAGVEKDVLKKMREVFASEEVVELSNLKALDRRKVMVEVKMVDGLLHNLVREGNGSQSTSVCRGIHGSRTVG